MRHYCHLDCLYTKALAEHWVKIFYESYAFYPARWLSAGYLAEKVLIANNVNIPYFDQIPYEVQKLARAAFYGGRFEMLYKGFVGKGYDYDINSAYPYALTTIPDLTEGRWIASKQVHPDAKLGFFHIVAQVHSSNRIAPFPFRQKSGRIFFPFGQFETDVTLPELRAVNVWISSSSGNAGSKVKYKIVQGYQFVANLGNSDGDCNYIFKDFILEQYQKRQLLKQQGSPLQRTNKVILNSIYGKTAQKTKVGRGKTVMGNLFCPVIASHVTGFTRAQLFSTTHQHNLEDDLVAYATDSITTRRPLANFAGDSLRQMKLANQGNDVFMIQNGIVRNNGVWKLRGVGFDRAKNIPIEHIETKETSDGRVIMTLQRLRPQRLKSAILTGRIKDVGKFLTYTKEINLNADSKRFWLGKLTSIQREDYFNSVPLDINLGGRMFANESGLEFLDELEDYNPYDNEV